MNAPPTMPYLPRRAVATSRSGGFVPEGMVPTGSDPISEAVRFRDRDIMRMVETAVRRKQTMLALQPVVRADENRAPTFYEGLVRLLDDTGRVIPAYQFIATIEDTELGRLIDCQALEHGLDLLTADPNLRISINMSARSIAYSPWRALLAAAMNRDRTIAERLILEISEASAMLMPEIVIAFMSNSQTMGISFALDDFGAGFTAFRHLRAFYFDVLKIDSQFVNGIAENVDNQVIMQALVAIGENMEMVSVATGVETEEDAQFLQGIGVECLQGYHIGAPLTMATKTQRENMGNSNH